MKFENRSSRGNMQRKNMYFSPQTLEQIDALREKFAFTSRASVVRACIEEVYGREMLDAGDA